VDRPAFYPHCAFITHILCGKNEKLNDRNKTRIKSNQGAHSLILSVGVAHQKLYVRQVVIFNRSTIFHGIAFVHIRANCTPGKSTKVLCKPIVCRARRRSSTIFRYPATAAVDGGYFVTPNEDKSLGPFLYPHPTQQTLLSIYSNSAPLQKPVIAVRLYVG
jgi:hypothetical protein